jgi:putative transposase
MLRTVFGRIKSLSATSIGSGTECPSLSAPPSKTARHGNQKFLRKTMKRIGPPHVIVTDLLRSYGAAMQVIGNADKQETGRWLNNRAENSHQPFRRRERAMLRFRQTRTLQKFASVHASIHNHFNQERHLYSRANFKLDRTAALAEWRQLGTA